MSPEEIKDSIKVAQDKINENNKKLTDLKLQIESENKKLANDVSKFTLLLKLVAACEQDEEFQKLAAGMIC